MQESPRSESSLKVILSLLTALAMPPSKYTPSTPGSIPAASIENTESVKPISIVFIDGWRSENTENVWKKTAERFREAGYQFFVADLHTAEGGPSQQKRTMGEFVAAVSARIEEIQKRPDVDPKKIVLFGYSFGANMAVHAGAERNAMAIITEALPKYPDSVLSPDMPVADVLNDRPRYLHLRQLRREPGALDSKQDLALRNFKGHLLCIFHENDATTPWRIFYRPCGANEKSSVVMLEGAPHGIDHGNPQRAETDALIIRWLRNPAANEFKVLNIVPDPGAVATTP